MKAPNLYHIEHPDRPMWVAATSFQDAITRWRAVIAQENELRLDDVEEPEGVQLVCCHEEYLA